MINTVCDRDGLLDPDWARVPRAADTGFSLAVVQVLKALSRSLAAGGDPAKLTRIA